MKKLLVLLMAPAVPGSAFADDAKVLPKGVFRLSFVFASNTFDESYDADGELGAAVYGEVNALTLGGALEFGVTDQITGAFSMGSCLCIFLKYRERSRELAAKRRQTVSWISL
ncbi:MAG: hypothetical protein MZU95_09275 [Desulfomicrobium escambiense]|nr:hypothetical protein [Desulfomicrobium escambiense]